MRHFVLLSSILLLSAVLAKAQYGGDSGAVSNTTATQTTVVGCIEGAVGKYTLTNSYGASYQLTGNTQQFNELAGDTVRVTGVYKPVVYVPGSMSEGTETTPTLSVISFQKVSGICSDDNNIPSR